MGFPTHTIPTSSKLSLLFILTALLSSCISHKDLLSVQSKNENSNNTVEINRTQSAYLLQSGDILSIKVSSLDPASIAIFNKAVGQTSSTLVNDAAIYMSSYVVNDSGFVNLPIIGNIAIKGLDLETAQKTVSERMNLYYKYASVDLKLMSFRVTVLGEVFQQGTFVIYNPNANILQLIGQAGGITDLGNRKRVRVIRKANDKSSLAYVDISSDLLMQSTYYYLQPNDVIYVEPLKAKSRRLDLPVIQVMLSGLTVLILTLSFLSK